MDFAAARRNMVASQIRTNEVTDPLVIEAMEAVPREAFVPEARRDFAYVDEDLPIGNGRHLIEPVALAQLLQLAEVQPGDKALVVGAGSGYSAAVLGYMAKAVVALESNVMLKDLAAKTLAAQSVANVTVAEGDLASGVPAQAPFDVILIDGAVSEIPAPLKRQLADGGRLVAVVRSGPVGRATLVERIGDAYGSRTDFDLVTPFLPEFAPQPKFVF